jgi:hypothetical protein
MVIIPPSIEAWERGMVIIPPSVEAWERGMVVVPPSIEAWERGMVVIPPSVEAWERGTILRSHFLRRIVAMSCLSLSTIERRELDTLVRMAGFGQILELMATRQSAA